MDARRLLVLFAFYSCLGLYLTPSFSHDEFIGVIAAAKPAVVEIEVTRSKGKIKSRQDVEFSGDNAGFFDEDLKKISSGFHGSRGTGFIVERASVEVVSILTAAHVVKGASKVKVLFSSGLKKKASIVWLSKKKDVALLEVNLQSDLFKPLILSEQLVMEGQSAISISASFHLSISSSLGIVSAVGVALPNKKGVPLIQTDAVVNPGSSGGPLLNSQGEVIGLISNIFTKTGAFSGVAFAVPASTVKKLVLSQDKKKKNEKGLNKNVR